MPQQKIDLNRADKDQLMGIDGVDEDIAGKIIAHRKIHGPFRSLQELDALAPLPADTMENLLTKGHVDIDPMAEERAKMSESFELKTSAFEDGAEIPAKYTCDGANVSPPLEWSGAPPETKSFALLVEDPDAPGGVFRHWALYDIAAERTRLPEATTHGAETERLGYGINDFGDPRYGGPCPPEGHGVHRYFFRLAALNVPTIQVPDQATAADVWQAAQAHMIAEAVVVGTYAR